MGTPRETCVLNDVLGEGLGNVLSLTFEFFEIAERAIEEHPDPEATHVFRWLQPHEVLLQRTLRREAWRHHCDELVRRFLEYRSLPFGRLREVMAGATEAELMVMLSEVSLSAGLHHEYVLVYEALVARVLPDLMNGAGPPTQYTVELLEELRRKHWCDGRAGISAPEVLSRDSGTSTQRRAIRSR